MKRLLVTATVVLLALVGTASTARSEPDSAGRAGLWLKGWGSVDLRAGLLEHRPFTCHGVGAVFCTTHDSLRLRGSRVVLVEKPYAGWKFAGWSGSCTGKESRCVIDVAHPRANAQGRRAVHIGARFSPVAPGFRRGHPISIGTTARLGNGLRLRVDSVLQNAQLSPLPPAGDEYLAADVTLTYGEGASPYATGAALGGWPVSSRQYTTYTIASDACPSDPPPELSLNSPIYRRESATGYVCWKVATSDAGTLELYYGTGGPSVGSTLWFALH